jgi:hypothetical protein
MTCRRVQRCTQRGVCDAGTRVPQSNVHVDLQAEPIYSVIELFRATTALQPAIATLLRCRYRHCVATYIHIVAQFAWAPDCAPRQATAGRTQRDTPPFVVQLMLLPSYHTAPRSSTTNPPTSTRTLLLSATCRPNRFLNKAPVLTHPHTPHTVQGSTRCLIFYHMKDRLTLLPVPRALLARCCCLAAKYCRGGWERGGGGGARPQRLETR